MSEDQTGRLIYLVILGCVIGGYFFLAHRHEMGRMVRQASLWGLLFVGVIVGYGLWSDVQTTVIPRQSVMENGQRIEIPIGADGHYHMRLIVNGKPVQFVVDTGATDIVLSQRDARRVGIDTESLGYLGQASTANGNVSTARVWLNSLSVGDVTESRVPAVVNGGEMEGSLLGMSYLNRFSNVQLGGGKMVLER